MLIILYQVKVDREVEQICREMLSWFGSKVCGSKVDGILLYIGWVMMANLSSDPQSFNRYTDVASWLHSAVRARPCFFSRVVADVL